MKIQLICAVAIVIFSQSAVSAQEKFKGETPRSENFCRNFPMPIIGLPLTLPFPMLEQDSFPVVKPKSDTDYKLIIINPCLSAMTQLQIPLKEGVPNVKKNKLLQTPPALESNNNTLEPAQNFGANGQNLVSSQPK